MANEKRKPKASTVEAAALAGVVESEYTLNISNEDIKVSVVRVAGKRISGNNGLLGEITGQALLDDVIVKSNGKGWTLHEGGIAIIKGDITSKKLHCYGGKLSTKKLLDVIGNYEAVKAYYTFYDSNTKMSTNLSINEKIFEWMLRYAEDAKISIGYIVSAIAAHDKATLSYAKKFMKKLRKDGNTVNSTVEDIDNTIKVLNDLTDHGDESSD